MSESSKKKRAAMRGREAKRLRTDLLQVGRTPEEAFRVRRADFPSLFFEGAVPQPILHAVDRFDTLRKSMQTQSVQAVLDKVGDVERKGYVEMLRYTAAKVVVEPRLSLSKRESLEDPDVLWVGGISDLPGDPKDVEEQGDVPLSMLMLIHRHVLGEAGLVYLDDTEADEFRPRERSDDAPAVPDGERVPSEAVVVAGGSDRAVAPAAASADQPADGDREKRRTIEREWVGFA
jgi:hypothetical protein